MDSEWKIRLLGGVLHGREVWLSDGQLSVGERGCDLCIPLDNEGKVILSAMNGQLFIDAGNAIVRVNGRRHKRGSPLPAEGILQTFGLAMAFGNQNANLSTYQLRSGSPVFLWLMALVLVLLVGVSGVVFWISNTAVPPQSIATRVNVLLRQTGLTQTKVSWGQDGTLQLSGYCQNSASLQTARLKLESWGVLYRDNVVCTDQLIRDVRDVLTQAGYADAQVTSFAPGEVRIRADITMGKRWAAIQPLLAELPGLTHWQINNPHEAQGKAIIDALIQNGLAGSVSVTPVGQAFVMSGVLNAPQQQIFNQLFDHIREQYPGIALSYQNVSASSEGSQRFPSPIAAIVHGRQGIYLVLEDRERLRIGSQLPDGSEVVALNDHAVALKYQGSLINYPFNF
ncbi:type III secretion system inner membrane ring subunit SctD [Yersinia aldovae]|uniref:Type-III secretion protein n=1 Tax=Yersinia aldovae TaxID=29483 RepID=A0A0T9U4E3_YERAL|nr:type III secretion system inner membrane ring subunit SctD [Yersinia aldovae]CNL19141.1 type-III secretion protein [Yersinia aldovae]